MKGLIPFVLLLLDSYANQAEAEEKSYSYEKMLNDTQTLEELYPENIKVGLIGESEWGNDIPYIQLGKGKETILLIGSHHAREWITTQILMGIYEGILMSYGEGDQEYWTKIMDNAS